MGMGPFDFVSVGLAAASGQLDMGTWAEYLAAFRPRVKRRTTVDLQEDLRGPPPDNVRYARMREAEHARAKRRGKFR